MHNNHQMEPRQQGHAEGTASLLNTAYQHRSRRRRGAWMIIVFAPEAS